MDILYPLGLGSKWQDNELRYSLLSVQKFMSGVDRVFIIGEVPRFRGPAPITEFPVIHIPAVDLNSCKEKNIRDKILLACKNREISENFLFMNDDHFVRKAVFVSAIPRYFRGTLEEHVKRRSSKPGGDNYTESLVRTSLALKERGLNTLYFDIHTPIIYNKTEFAAAMAKYDWTHKRGYVIKSLYGNSVGGGNLASAKDCKIDVPLYREEIEDRVLNHDFFSVGDSGLNHDMKQFLKDQFGS